MVSMLKFFKADPQKKKHRGQGWYYHRGKGIYSKYGERQGGYKHDGTVKAKHKYKNPLKANIGDIRNNRLKATHVKKHGIKYV